MILPPITVEIAILDSADLLGFCGFGSFGGYGLASSKTYDISLGSLGSIRSDAGRTSGCSSATGYDLAANKIGSAGY